ncbi:hypothetical protein GCM10018787_42600 [Streptomyces thermodiastaticus]|nr:hypothetical protein GCM10018787_42600 [Streptomyces thermodiastaticus]
MAASRNLAEGPEDGSRYTTCVATLPTTQTIVSFIVRHPSLAPPAAAAGRTHVRPVPYSGGWCGDRIRRADVPSSSTTSVTPSHPLRSPRNQAASAAPSPLGPVDHRMPVDNSATRSGEAGEGQGGAAPK